VQPDASDSHLAKNANSSKNKIQASVSPILPKEKKPEPDSSSTLLEKHKKLIGKRNNKERDN